MLHIIWSLIIGFIVGLIARAVMPGAQNLGFFVTSFIGIGGSILGGLIGRVISKPSSDQPVHPAGLLMSVLGAVLVLFIYGKLQTP